ncbi:13200_t:CDS:2, partial [Racocetra fulgida]
MANEISQNFLHEVIKLQNFCKGRLLSITFEPSHLTIVRDVFDYTRALRNRNNCIITTKLLIPVDQKYEYATESLEDEYLNQESENSMENQEHEYSTLNEFLETSNNPEDVFIKINSHLEALQSCEFLKEYKELFSLWKTKAVKTFGNDAMNSTKANEIKQKSQIKFVNNAKKRTTSQDNNKIKSWQDVDENEESSNSIIDNEEPSKNTKSDFDNEITRQQHTTALTIPPIQETTIDFSDNIDSIQTGLRKWREINSKIFKFKQIITEAKWKNFLTLDLAYEALRKVINQEPTIDQYDNDTEFGKESENDGVRKKIEAGIPLGKNANEQ